MQALGLQDSGCWSCRCRDCGSSSIPSSGGPDSSLSHRGYIKAQPQAFAYERGASGFGFCKVHNFALSNCSPRTPCTKLACPFEGLRIQAYRVCRFACWVQAQEFRVSLLCKAQFSSRNICQSGANPKLATHCNGLGECHV